MTATAQSKTRRDYLAVVEAAYDLGAGEADWIRGIAEAARPILDTGLGAHAYVYDASDFGCVKLGRFVQAGGVASNEAVTRALTAALTAEEARVFYSASPPAEVITNIFRGSRQPNEAVVTLMGGMGVGDAIGVRGHNPDQTGCIISAPSRDRYPIAPKMKAAITNVALHLAAACRLRATRGTIAPDEDAVFSRTGTLEHLPARATASAQRSALLTGVERRQFGRRIRSEEPERALELWRALVAGRWSLVDHVDTDGKRFILARRNDPNLPHPAALEHDERLVALYTSWGHSNKLTSYELGLAPSRVSELLRSALRKLRVRSRSELIRLFSPEGAK